MTDKQIKIRMEVIKFLCSFGAKTIKEGTKDSEFNDKIAALAGEFAEELTPHQDRVRELFGHEEDAKHIPHLMNELLAIRRYEKRKFQ